MTLEDLKAIDLTGRNVLVIGCPAAGKTHISELLCYDESHELIHCDELINAGYALPQAMWAIFEEVSEYNRKGKRTIVEGVLGYELLLEGFKHKAYLPDVVIEIKISGGRQRQIFLAERDPDKIKYLRKFNLCNLQLLNEWFKISDHASSKPLFIQFINNY